MPNQEPTAEPTAASAGSGAQEAAGQESQGEGVFSTAHLVWLDLETGDELSIELFGPRPFLEELMAQGFHLKDGATTSGVPDPDATSRRIQARVGRN